MKLILPNYGTSDCTYIVYWLNFTFHEAYFSYGTNDFSYIAYLCKDMCYKVYSSQL